MSGFYTLRYRTFDQLLAEAYSDFPKYHQSGLIQPHTLIKVAKLVNYELGLRIYQTKEAILEVEKGRVRLPNNFYVLNYAFMCDKYEIKVPVSQGTHIEERRVDIPTYQWQPDTINTCTDPVEPEPCSPCPSCHSETPCSCNTGTCEPRPQVCLNCKGEEWELIQKVQYQTRSYKHFFPLRILESSQDVECGCPNLYMDGINTAWIKDGWLYTNFDCGKVYINYEGMLEDDDGNVLVPDHERLNEFYEYALKRRILENLVMNDEPVSPAKIQLIENNYRAARNNAISLVRMPNFGELKKVYESNRKAQYSKYYDMFSGYSQFNINRERFFNGGLSKVRI
jgi:hypothetical protein